MITARNIIEESHKINGTSLMGHVHASYETLVSIFGEPERLTEETGDGKVDCEWIIEFVLEGESKTTVVATIYNWKNGPSYGGLQVEQITDWNIGGHSRAAANLVNSFVEGK